MIERRTKPRFRLKSPIATKVRTTLNARMLDISPEGALLELGYPVAPNLACDLRIRYDAADLVVAATVCRCKTGNAKVTAGGKKLQFFLAGIRFEESARAAIAALLSRIPPDSMEQERMQDAEFGASELARAGGTRWLSEADVSVRIAGSDALEPHPMAPPPERERS